MCSGSIFTDAHAELYSQLTVNWQLLTNWVKAQVIVTLRLTVSQLVLVSSPIWGSWPDIYYWLTVTVLYLWGALSDDRTALSFVYAVGPCQRSLFRVRVPWDSRLYFTVSDLRLPFSSPLTTRRVTVQVFDPVSTRVTNWVTPTVFKRTPRHGPHRKHSFHCLSPTVAAA
jgi:hypothetical protein